MNKYISLFKISFQQEFVYRVNFIMWRVRNVVQLFLIFFLWDAVFANSGKIVFGYDRVKILTYVFGLILVKALVLSSRAIDVAGEIANGDLSNYLIKPTSYFKYWMTRDISSKVLNLVFAVFETFLLYLILKPPFFLQTNPVSLLGFILAIIIAFLIFFILTFVVSTIPFWIPEAAWGVQFLIIVVLIESLSGSLFPLDILPNNIQNILNLTPFPYLIFFPLQVYLGKITGLALIKGIVIGTAWGLVLWIFLNNVWKRGMKVYQASGR